MKLEDMFTSGLKVDETYDTCYIPIFMSMHQDQTKWLLGNIFMSLYYTVFDMDQMVIGIAPSNPENLIYSNGGFEDTEYNH